MAPFIIFSTNFLSIYITIFVYSTVDGDTSMCPLSCHKISLTKLYLYSIFHHLLSSNIVYKFPRVGEFSQLRMKCHACRLFFAKKELYLFLICTSTTYSSYHKIMIAANKRRENQTRGMLKDQSQSGMPEPHAGVRHSRSQPSECGHVWWLGRKSVHDTNIHFLYQYLAN